MKNSNENNIIFYRAWWDSLSTKSPDFRHAVLDAVFAYAFEEISPSFPTESGLQIAFENMASFIDSNREKFALKQEKRREAAEARWRDLNAKNANACYDMQNMQMHSPARPNKDKDKDNVKDKDKDNSSKADRDKSLSLSQNDNKNSSAEDAERERVVFDYALFLLAEGRVSAYENALAAYEYNEALGWQREICRRNGDTVQQPIRYKLNWLKSREQKPPQEFDAPHGELLAVILRRVGLRPQSADIINLFRGIAFRGSELCFLYSRLSPPVRSFAQAISSVARIHNIVVEEVAKRYPNTESINIITKSSL